MDGGRSRMAVALVTSATAHAVALAIVIALAPRTLGRTSPPIVLPISLVSISGGGGGGAPGAPAPEPSPPPPAAAAPEPTPMPDVVRPQPLPSQIVRPAKAPKPRPPHAASAQVASVPSPGAQPGGVPGGTGTGSGGGGDGGGTGMGFSGASPGYGVNPEPPYPLAARRLGYEGEVLLRVFVAADGRPTNVVVLKSSGHDMLDQSALETIRTRWRFVPARRNGVPVDDTVQVPIMFRRSAG